MKEPAIGCVKEATRILGDKWTPQLLRFFANEPSLRFVNIQDSVGTINPRTLSARLSALELEGVIEKLEKPNTTRCEYCLTDKGRALIPILKAMETWGEKYPPESGENCIS